MPFALVIDPIFSEKSLDFSQYPKLGIDFSAKTTELYGSEPIYFRLEGSEEINAEIRQFVDSEQFPLFVNQLKICFEEINAFIDEHNIQVKTKLIEFTGDQNLLHDVEISAKFLVNRFFDKLKTDNYSDRRAILYADGKKYLESFSILIAQSTINLDERITQLRTLVDEDGLEVCADGCYSRLQEAVENLKTSLDSNVHGWMRKFLKNQLEEVVRKPRLLSAKTPAQKLASILQQSLEANEIHFNNWLKEKLKDKFQLNFIEKSEDIYVDLTNSYLAHPERYPQQQAALVLVAKMETNFLKTLTASNFVKFIGTQLYQQLHNAMPFNELVEKSEIYLNILGKDNTFSLGEIIDSDTYKIKSEQALYKTITLRLLNSQFFNKNPAIRETEILLKNSVQNKYVFELFGNNLVLNLIKRNSDEEYFLSILEFFKRPGSLTQVLSNLAVNEKSTLLKHLIQTPEDFALFLNKVNLVSLPQIDALLAEIHSALKYSSDFFIGRHSIDDTVREHMIPYNSFEKTLLILIRLTGNVDQPGASRNLFYESIISPPIFNAGLSFFINTHLGSGSIWHETESALVVKNVLNQLLTMKVNDFFGLSFPNDESGTVYLNALDFSKTDFTRVKVMTPIYKCAFRETILNGINVLTPIHESDLQLSSMDNANWGEIITANFNSAKISKTNFRKVIRNVDFTKTEISMTNFIGEVSVSYFNLAKITEINFHEIITATEFRAAAISKTDFHKNVLGCYFSASDPEKFTKISETNFHQLVAGSEFLEAEISATNFMGAVSDSKFEEAKISATSFMGEVSDSQFEGAKISETNFMDAVFSSHFIAQAGDPEKTQTTISDVTFQSIAEAFFIHVQFNNLKIASVVTLCTFIESFIDKGEFKGELNRVYFQHSHLKNVAIFSIKNKALFENAKLEDVIFKKIIENNIDDKLEIKFNEAHLKRVSFESIEWLEQSEFHGLDFTKTILEDITLESLNLGSVIFSETQFKNVVFKNVQFKNDAWFTDCDFSEVTFSDCDLNQVLFGDKNTQKKLEIKLERVVLNPYQLNSFYSAGILDFSTIILTENSEAHFFYVESGDAVFLEAIPAEQRVKEFLSRVTLPGARLSEQAVRYLRDKDFKFSGVDLCHIDFKDNNFVGIQLEEATISFTQALQLFLQGQNNFSKAHILIELDMLKAQSAQLLQTVVQHDQGAGFLFRLIAQADSSGDAQQRRTYQEITKEIHEVAKEIFNGLNAEQQREWLKKITQQALELNRSGERKAGEQLQLLREEIVNNLPNIEALVKTQRLYHQLEIELKKVFNKDGGYPTHGSVNQWEILSLLSEQPVVRGRCLGFTKGFSESLRQGRMGAYLSSLKELLLVKARLKRGYRLSVDERVQLQAFYEVLGRLEEQGLSDSVWERVYEINSIKLVKKSLPQSLIMAMEGAEAKGDYTIHLTIGSGRRNPRHQVGVFRVNRRYHYFDSNAGYVIGIENSHQFLRFLEGVLPKSYGSESRRLAFELYQLKTRESEALRQTYEPLFNFRSERSRLTTQDQTLDLLYLNGVIVNRVSLYDWGIGYLDESDKLVSPIDAKSVLTDKTLIEGLQKRHLRVDKHSYEERIACLLIRVKKQGVAGLEDELRIAQKLLPFVQDLKREKYLAVDSTLNRYLMMDFTDIPDLRIERKLKEMSSNRQVDFEKHLTEADLKQSLLKKAKSQLEKNQKLLQTGSSTALSTLVLSKTLFDIGKSIVQGDVENSLIGASLLSYALILSPRIERWATEKSETLLRKLNIQAQNFFKGRRSQANSLDQLKKTTKKIKWVARGLGGVVGNLLDVKDFALGIKELIEAEYGSKPWEDGIFETSLASISLGGGVALTIAGSSGPAGAAFAVLIIMTSGSYYGIQTFKEYERYGLTLQEGFRIFGHGFLGLEMPEDMQYLQARTEMVNELARNGCVRLQALPSHFVGYASGMGEYVLNKPWYKEQFKFTHHQKALNNPINSIMPGVSIINRSPPSPDYARHLSRIIPAKPNASLRYHCLPNFRGESIETEGEPFGSVYGLYTASNTVQYDCENAFMFVNKTREAMAKENELKSTILVDLALVRGGKTSGFKNYSMVFEIYGSDTDLGIHGTSFRKNEFRVNDPRFRGRIHGGEEGTNIVYLPFMPDPETHINSYQSFIRIKCPNVAGPQISFYGTEDDSVLFSADGMQALIGEKDRTEIIACEINERGESSDLLVQSQGGFTDRLETISPKNYNVVDAFSKALAFPRNWDVIEYCENVILEKNSHYRANAARWGKLSIGVVSEKFGRVHITPEYNRKAIDPIEKPAKALNDILSQQAIQFLDAKLLDDMDIYYQLETNTLVLKKVFFEIELRHYFNFVEKRSNYQLINSEKSWIQPVLASYLIPWWKQNKLAEILLQQFILSHHIENARVLNLGTAELYVEKNQRGEKSIQVVSSVSTTTANGSKFKWYFGSSGNDILFLDADVVQGGEGSDSYILSSPTEYSVISNLAEASGKTKVLEVDQLLLFKEKGMPLPFQWEVERPGTGIPGITLSTLSEALEPIGVHLSLYLVSANHQHLMIRYVEEDGDDSFWIPLQVNEEQFVLTPYYPNQPTAVHWLSLVNNVSQTIVIEARKSEKFQWLRSKEDLIIEGEKKQKWVLDNYYTHSTHWKDFKICTTQQAGLVSLHKNDAIHCLDAESFRAGAVLAIDIDSIMAQIREQQIKRYPLTLNLSQQVIEHPGPLALSSDHSLGGYLDIPYYLKVSRIMAQPTGEKQKNLQLQIHTLDKNYTVLVKNAMLPTGLHYVRYGTLVTNLEWRMTDPVNRQKSLDLSLLAQQFGKHLDSLSIEQRKGLTLLQLVCLFYLEPTRQEDLLAYFFMLEKGLDLPPNELDTYLQWLEKSPENGFNQIKTALENPEVVKNLLYLAMKAATQEELSQHSFGQCFTLLDSTLRRSLWEKVREPFKVDESVPQRLEKLKHWLESHIQDVMDSIRSESASWTSANASLPAFFVQINHLNDLVETKDSRYQKVSLDTNVVKAKLNQEAVSTPKSGNNKETVSSWLSWLARGFGTIGCFAVGYWAWTSRHRFRLGYSRARVVSLGMGGTTVLEFDQADAAQGKEPVLSEVEKLESKSFPALDEKLIKPDVIEATRYESAIASLAKNLSENIPSLAFVLGEKFRKKREERYIKVDSARKVRISQLEERQIKFELENLVNVFIQNIEITLKRKTEISLTDVVTLIVKRLMDDPYKDYLSRLTHNQLSEEIEACLQSKLSFQAVLANLQPFLTSLFFEKVYQKFKNIPFSPIEELAENQKSALLKIIPAITQTGEDFVASLTIVANPSSQNNVLKFVNSTFNFFKPVKTTNIEGSASRFANNDAFLIFGKDKRCVHTK